MAEIIDLSGLTHMQERFARLANPNPLPLLITWANILDEDNRRGVLAGQDKDGAPLAPVTYRPARPGTKSVKLTVSQRLGQTARKKRGKYSRIGSGIERANNNLTSAEYRLLDGPPLAPRRQFSRVISNYMQSSGQVGSRTWEVVGAWINVLTQRGMPFLHYHFNGIGQKRRDLRGIRAWGRERCRTSLRNWMIDQIRSGD